MSALDSNVSLDSASSAVQEKFSAPETVETITRALAAPTPTLIPDNYFSEVAAYSEHITNVLRDRKILFPKYLPITVENDLITACRDGVLLGHLISIAKPTSGLDVKKLNYSIDWSTLGEKHSKTIFELNEQLNLIVRTAKSSGYITVNIGSEDFLTSAFLSPTIPKYGSKKI